MSRMNDEEVLVLNQVRMYIQQKLIQYDMSTPELADKLGVTKKAVYLWLEGRTSISLYNFSKLVSLFGNSIVVAKLDTVFDYGQNTTTETA